MVVSEVLRAATDTLKRAGIPRPRLDAAVLLCHSLQTDRLGLLRIQDQPLTEKAYAQFCALLQKRADRVPVAYLVGHKEFMSLDFTVTPAVLIPRPDTEALCEVALQQAKRYIKPSVLDLCCGSGCIGISLAHYLPEASVCLTDVSEAAVYIAKENAMRLAPENTNVFVSDVLKPNAYGEFDILVSNPPYIETQTIAALDPDVRDYEPHIALDGGGDGLLFYRYFARHMQAHLHTGGMLVLEVGHTQADAVAALLRAQGWTDVQTACDLAGIQRVVYGFKH